MELRGPIIDAVWASDGSWPDDLRILPDGGADLIWTGDALVVAGPDRAARMVRRPPSMPPACGVRFLPGAARLAFGWSGEALVDTTVPAAEVLGERAADDLTRRLAGAPPDGRPRLLAGWAVSDRRSRDHRDPVVAHVARTLRADPSRRVAELAGEVGYSERQLRRRVQTEVGYPPKLLARILRLRRAVEIAGADPAVSLADTAAAAGYVDQAHLGHEVAALADTTPAMLLHR
ncbi:MAG: helix-turn-helix domain-containing protein [Solirubrobacteraceae bacterium]|nr:helix-turn-helix domain-containing protein [Solirubrobacteraceae bacterium]